MLLSRVRRLALSFGPTSSVSFWERILEILAWESLWGQINWENVHRRRARVVLTNIYVLVLVYYFERSLLHFFFLLFRHHIEHIAFTRQPVICPILMGWVGSWECPYFVGSIITWRLSWAAASQKVLQMTGYLFSCLLASDTPPVCAEWPFRAARWAFSSAFGESILWESVPRRRE